MADWWSPVIAAASGLVCWLPSHPLLVGLLNSFFTLLLGSIAAYFLAERWQRWRQRRDFQFRTMVQFSQLSEEISTRLSELSTMRGPGRNDFDSRYRDFIYRHSVLLALRSDLLAAFKAPDIRQDFSKLTGTARQVSDLSAQDHLEPGMFEPIQARMRLLQELVITRMVGEMKLLKKGEVRQAVNDVKDRLAAAAQSQGAGGEGAAERRS